VRFINHTIGLWFCLIVGAPAYGQVPLPEMGPLAKADLAYHDVVVEVSEINAISVSSNTVSLTIDSAVAGQDPSDDTDNSKTYNVTVNGAGKKITGELDSDYASGISLSVLLSPPTGASSVQKTLSTTTQDLVTGVSHTATQGLTITYTASAAATAVPNEGGGGETHTVTITLTDS